MNDNIISNTYIIKDIFLNDNYDSLINFAKTPYNTRFHKYSEVISPLLFSTFL